MVKKPQYRITATIKGTGPYTLIGMLPGELEPDQKLTEHHGSYTMNNGLEVHLELRRESWIMIIEASKRWQQDLIRKIHGRKVWRLYEDGKFVGSYDPLQDNFQGQLRVRPRLRAASNPHGRSRSLQGGAPGLRQQKHK